MAEPTTSTAAVHGGASLLGALVIAFGPVLGPWIAVVFAAIVGSLWTVGKVETETRLQAVLVWARTVMTACVLTGGCAVLMGSYTDAPMEYMLPFTAFVLGMLGDKFESLKDEVASRARSWIGGNKQ